jgi:hypothetical protein
MHSIAVVLVILILSAGVSGCATAPLEPKSAHESVIAVNGGDIQCRTERPTGSNLGVQVCTTKAQRDAVKANTQTFREELGRTQAGPCTAPGCK